MTVKQLREWLIKQDETALVQAVVEDGGSWDSNFELRAISSVDAGEYSAVEGKP